MVKSGEQFDLPGDFLVEQFTFWVQGNSFDGIQPSIQLISDL